MGFKVKSRDGDEWERMEDEKHDEEPEEEQWQEVDEVEEEKELSPIEVKEIELANEKWKEFLGEVKEHDTQTLTWGVPICSRNSRDVIAGLSCIFNRFQMLQIPMYRLHSDRAREFLSAEVRRWATLHNLMQTYTAGDEPEGNARTEREIGLVKARTRLLLRTSKSPVSYWPLAARQALEERCRMQLWRLGVPCPQVLPFGATAVARRKSWFNRSEPWKWPMERVRVFGPAADMSVSSRGHYVQLQNGKFVRSTVIVIPTQTAETISEVREQGKELLNKDRQVEDAQGNAEEAPLDIGNQPAEEALKGSEFLEVDVKDVLMEEQSEQDQGEKGLRFGNASAQLQRPKRTRLHKKSPPDSFYPELQDQKEHGSTSTSLRRLQGWGEWGEDQMMQDMEVWQHQELKDKLQQSWSDWLESVGGGDSGQKLQEMEQFKIEAETLERILEKKEDQVQAKMRALTVQVEKEVLQTRVVSMEEVRAHPEEWKEAFQKEYNTLTAGPVVPISQQEFEDLVTSKTELEILPMKGVATLKPPNRHKARIVVCGNYSTNVPDVDISVGGVCATTIRAAAHVSVVRGC